MIAEFKPQDLLAIRYQAQQNAACSQTLGHAEVVATGWCAFTAWHDGKPLICAGIMEIWPGRAMAWASFDYAARPVMVEAHRKTLTELDRCPYKRIEMYVRPGFVEAARWAGLLGFKLESRMECGAPDGSDLLVYTLFKRSRAVRDLTWSSPL